MSFLVLKTKKAVWLPRLRLKREAGLNPARSRHCDWLMLYPASRGATVLKQMGRRNGCVAKSQETCQRFDL